MSVKDAKQQIFDSLYNDFINTGKNPSIDAEGLRKQLNIPEDEFSQALHQFADSSYHSQMYVEVDIQTKQVRLGASGMQKRETF